MTEHTVTITLPEECHKYADSAWASIGESLRRDGYGWMAESIEEQVKPAIEEPTEFGSVVRAKAPELEMQLWTPDAKHGKHYWMAEDGEVEVWSELTDVEVLRVGLGDDALSEAYSRGYEEGVQSNLPSPVDRSNINSVLREAIAKINLREGRLVVERDSLELADAVMGAL